MRLPYTIPLTLLSGLLAGPVCAAPGDLDPAFGGGAGFVTTPLGAGSAKCIAVQSDGKIVIAGSSGGGEFTDFTLVRCLPDGTMDTSFNGTGRVVASPELYGNIESVAVQPDGKIVAAGWSHDGNRSAVALLRYLPDGSSDISFNATGRVFTVVAGSDAHAYGIVLQTDGKIVVAGNSYNGTTHRFLLARFHADGTPDATFGEAGLTSAPAASTRDIFESVILQPDGKILAAGTFNNAFGVARYLVDGSLDTAFNGTGFIITSISGFQDGCHSIFLQRDGKIFAAGNSFVGSYDFALVRYHPDGSLDTSFDGDGIVNLPAGPGAHICFGAAIQPDGKILAAGHFNNQSFTLVRYLPNGSYDTSFGGTGVVNTTIGDRSSGFCMALQNDGKVLVAGSSLSGTDYRFAIARYQGRAPTPLLDAWRQTHFGTANEIGDAADASDPDQDGLDNLMEFATGGDPHAAGPPSMQSSITLAGLELIWTRRDALDEVLCEVERSTTLEPPWRPASAETVLIPGGGALQQMKTILPAAPGGRQFIRLHAARH